MQPWQYYDKNKKGYYVKYEIACSIGVPRVIWLSGPWKITDDGKIADFSELLDQIKGDEFFFADKGYRHKDEWFLCPITGEKYQLPKEDRTRNYIIYCIRQTIERVIHRVRFWHILKDHIWTSSIKIHGLLVKVLCKLLNFFLLFQPLG